MRSGVGTLVGGLKPVEIIQMLLLGGEGGKKTILLSEGGGPGFALNLGVSVPIPGVVRLGPVLGTGPVKIRLRLVPSVVPARLIVLIPPAIGLEQGRTPDPRKGSRFFPGLVGVGATVSVALGISRAMETSVRIDRR